MTTASTPINTTGDTLGSALDTSDFVRPSFTTNFSTLPSWHVGKVEPLVANTVAPSLANTDFYLTAGYYHNTPSPQEPSYVPPGKPYPGFSWLSAELAPYPNGDAIAATGHNPFSANSGILTITADHTPANVIPWLPVGYSQEFISGAMNSFPFSQQYGYFEAKLKIPSGRGLWPAFWLLPSDGLWPPENDIIEVLGQTPDILYTTLHDAALKSANTTSQVSYGTNTGEDLSQGYHLYGCDWGPDKVRYYLDRKLIFSYPTPGNWHQPFYWIVNLAVGGPTAWPGAPDATTVFPAHLNVAYVQVWQRKSYLM